MSQAFINIEPQGLLRSKERAEAISRELYNISRPVHIQREDEKGVKLFSVIDHPIQEGRAALEVFTDRLIECHPEAVLERLVALFPEVSEAERYFLSSSIHQSTILTFGVMLPSTVTLRDVTYMLKEGFFYPDDSLE